jgi:hypothetical protein
MTHDADVSSTPVTDIGAYCRAVESHLCRVNGGHLVRIVGPAFELVAGWAKEGVPLRVVLHGVDRTITRLTAKGPRRRPVRIEFCEADVRDAADQWRRAVGVRAAATAPTATVGAADSAAAARVSSLPKHLERVLVRLSALAATRDWPPSLVDALAGTIRDVDTCLDASRVARRQARTAILDQLGAIERAMTQAALASVPEARRRELLDQVRTELTPYREQMPAAAYRDAEEALLGELVRKHFSLPQVRLDG